MNQSEKSQLQQVAMLVKRRMETDETGHDFDHVKRVIRNAQLVLSREKKADEFLVLLTCYLHDFYDEKLVSDVADEKANLRQYLMDVIEIDPATINEVFKIIDQMSFSHNLDHDEELSLEGQVVQDADRLDAIGAIGIVRTIRYGTAHGFVDYDENIPPRTDEELTEENYREDTPILNHFYEKLFKLEKLMNTKYAKKLAKDRNKFMHEFVTEYKAEYHGEK